MGDILDITSLVFHLINLIILFVVVRLLVYKPLVAFLKKRSDRFGSERQELTDMRQAADEQVAKGEQMMATAREDAERIAEDRLKQAEVDAAKIVAEAEHRAGEFTEMVQAEANEDARRIRETARAEVARMAIGVASKLLKRELDKPEHQELVDDFLSKVE